MENPAIQLPETAAGTEENSIIESNDDSVLIRVLRAAE